MGFRAKGVVLMDWFPTRTRTCDVMLFVAVRMVEERRKDGMKDDDIIKEIVEA